MKARCKLCDWVNKAQTGVYASHFIAREHMKIHHPQDFQVMEAGEQRLRQLQRQLAEQFGQAVKPQNMT